jgi:two-component system, chemotaxis family, protein-glutamate methylesterase/glutaminase
MASNRKLSVLVVDDSAYNRRTIADILGGASDIELVGKAGDGEEALQLVGQLKPDAITLDLEMPRMDGFTFLRILMARQPTPVIVISSYSKKENIFKALELGAIDFVAKPERQPVLDAAFRDELLTKISLVRSLRPLRPTAIPPRPSLPSIVNEIPAVRQGGPVRHLVAVASSTGGPTALVDIFSKIPERFPGAILVAQHMPDKFTRTFAERLNKKGHLRVTEAEDFDLVENRTGFVCPGRLCMGVEVVPSSAGAGGELRLRVKPPEADDRYVPSGDRLLRSAAKSAGSRAIGIILTGMGDDGVGGAREIREVGGTVIAESEETAVVNGMPAAAVRAGVVDEVLTLEEIGEFLALLA